MTGAAKSKMNDERIGSANEPVVALDDVRRAIDLAGYKATPALEVEVTRLVRESLREALVTRAFNAVRINARRREAR